MEILKSNHRKSALWKTSALYGLILTLGVVFLSNRFLNSKTEDKSMLLQIKEERKEKLAKWNKEKKGILVEMERLNIQIEKASSQEIDLEKVERLNKSIDQIEADKQSWNEGITEQEKTITIKRAELEACKNNK